MTEVLKNKLITLHYNKEKELSKKWLEEIEMEWPIIEKTKGHRTEIKPIQNIKKIKTYLLDKLSTITIAIFLKFYGSLGDHVLSHKNIDKGVLILYRLLSGKTQSEMEIPQTNFSLIFAELFDKKYETRKNKDKNNTWKLIKFCDNWISKFSNLDVRILYSKIHNPIKFKPITLMMDSKDFIIIFNETSVDFEENESGKSNLLSRKNNWKNGGKTCFLIDSRNMLVSISNTEGANAIYDSKFYEIMNIKNIMKPQDTLVCDHHFDKGYKELIEKYPNLNLQLKNYCANVYKQ
jgi:hypothetical protein